ncbi:MAG TPA: hypothetical protein PLU71_01795 [Candidatus Dependentiae bacterium]|nr:hypothetical protein [Candidatus Dependentiae bacterium]HRQ62564.1 hypothetical protein [Candidatus Dependentiae bacterium]
MEKVVRSKTWYIVLLTVWSAWLQADCVPLDLQSPMRSSWYKKSFDSCMQAWHAASILQQDNSDAVSEDECTIHINVLMGQLVFASFCLDHCIHTRMRVVPDDITYLMQIVNRIRQCCSTLMSTCAEHIGCAQHTLHTMTHQLEQLYGLQQTNYAGISSGK